MEFGALPMGKRNIFIPTAKERNLAESPLFLEKIDVQIEFLQWYLAWAKEIHSEKFELGTNLI